MSSYCTAFGKTFAGIKLKLSSIELGKLIGKKMSLFINDLLPKSAHFLLKLCTFWRDIAALNCVTLSQNSADCTKK